MYKRRSKVIFVLGLFFVAQNLNAASETMSQDALYKEECGTCHLAYPADFLPSRSWKKIMTTLEDHFDENAELSDDVAENLMSYLSRNSGEHTTNKHRRKFSRSIKGGATPLRITALPYFKKEHREVPSRLIKGNPEVRSLTHCAACHKKAESGSFREREIVIPGYGRWDD